ncbi:type II secretion system protein GspG, partial [Candidatus Sumerlaeota bacterium]
LFSQPTAVDPKEMSEWTEWDQWALEVHEQLGSRFMFGGQAIDNLAKQAAEDGKRVEALHQEAAANISLNREGDHVDALKKAFFAFYLDTNHAPTEKEGFEALIKNTGNWPDWKGPYLKGADATLPPKDRWGTPIRYVKTKTLGGTEIMIVVSCGPNKLYNQGSSDDIKTYVNYKIARRLPRR